MSAPELTSRDQVSPGQASPHVGVQRSPRLAVAGKGGAGKTTLSATLARILARRLGGPGLVEPVPAVMKRYGAEAPDSVSVVHMAMPAHADEGCLCSAHATVSGLLADAAYEPDAVTLVDLEASPEHLSRGTTRHVDILLLVVEPYYRSLETARRMAQLASELPIPHVGVVANKLRTESDGEAIVEFCAGHGLEVDGRLPWSDAVLDADKAGVPLLDYEPEGPMVQAISQLADRVTTLGGLGAHVPAG